MAILGYCVVAVAVAVAAGVAAGVGAGVGGAAGVCTVAAAVFDGRRAGRGGRGW